MTAVGGRLPAGSMIVTGIVVVPVAPNSSVTVSTTLNVPGALYVFVATAPEPPLPSPKFHEYVRAGVFSSVDVRPSNVHTLAAHDTVPWATGGLFGGR